MNQDNNRSHLVQLDTTASKKSAATYETEWNQMHSLYNNLL